MSVDNHNNLEQKPKNLVATKKPSKSFFRFDPIATIVSLLIIFFASQFAAALLVGGYADIFSLGKFWLEDSTIAQFAFIAITEVIAIFSVIQLARLARIKLSRIGLVHPVLMDLVRALLSYAVYFVFLMVVMGVLSSHSLVDTEQKQQVGFGSASTVKDLLLVFTSLVILVPIAEEIMFRGFLFSSLRAKYGFVISALVTSIIFGVAHLQFGSGAPLLWSVAVDTLMLSLIMCYIRERSGSLWPSIFLHSIKNGIAFMVLFGTRLM